MQNKIRVQADNKAYEGAADLKYLERPVTAR
jgi:hypothetical protein